MTADPTLTIRVDWAADGAFTGALDDVSAALLDGVSWTRGRSADFSAEATGQAQFTLSNHDDRFTPDRQWCDNPSFEVDTTGWSITPARGMPCTSISRVDPGTKMTGAGDWSGQVTCPATIWSGAGYAMPYTFRSGVTYTFSLGIKTISGATGLVFGICSTVTTSDYAESAVTATGPWVRSTLTWTPSADRTGASIYVLVASAAAAAFVIDGVQVNPGATANTYIEAPTKGQLVPGRPVHIYATYGGTDYPQFFGYIQRLSPNARDRTVAITTYDVLQRMSEVDVVVPATGLLQRTARDFRVDALSDYERGLINLCHNGSIETDTSGWTNSGGTVTRTTGDSVLGSASLEFATVSANSYLFFALRLAPVFLVGERYRISVWLKLGSGNATWMMGAYQGIYQESPDTRLGAQSITLTGAWTRHTFMVTVTEEHTGSSPLGFFLKNTGTSTILVDGLMVTRGYIDWTYGDTRVGRWPNWCGNGSFDAGSLAGLRQGHANLVGNPSFASDTSGWSVATDAFHASSTSITRSTAQAAFGTASGLVSPPSATKGAHYTMSGTFLTGVTYIASVYAYRVAGTADIVVGIGSNGTPADKAQASAVAVSQSWVRLTIAWTPSGDRSDVHLYVIDSGGTDYYLDGAQVVRKDPALVAETYPYSDTGAGGGGSFVTTRATSTTAKYGYQSLSLATPATATAGQVYDFFTFGSYFLAGQPYTLSVWIRPSSSMPYKVGIGSNKGDGAWDEASATGTASANVWTQVTVTWTPTADRSSLAALTTLAYVYQTDATARTILVDGLRVIPASAADDFEMAQWVLATEPDAYGTAASASGSALSVLGTVNGWALSRHWIEPTMASPWYEYHTAARGDVKTSAETFDNDMQDLSTADIDRASIVNVVPVVQAAGIVYHSDETSIRKYGERPTGLVGAYTLSLSAADSASIGGSLIARYKDPKARPTMTVADRFPSQLVRELDDVVTVTSGRGLVYGQPFSILSFTTRVGPGWVTSYVLEEV